MPKFCPECGKPISEKVKFCPECGSNIDSYKSNSEKRFTPAIIDNPPDDIKYKDGFTRISGIANNVKNMHSTSGSVHTDYQGRTYGSINTSHWTDFRVNNRACWCDGTPSINNGDRVTVAGEGEGELRVWVWYNKTTNLIHTLDLTKYKIGNFLLVFIGALGPLFVILAFIMSALNKGYQYAFKDILQNIPGYIFLLIMVAVWCWFWWGWLNRNCCNTMRACEKLNEIIRE
jgi:hypothetical protein